MGEHLLKGSATFMAGFDQLLKEGNFVDCSLAAEGQTLKAHRAVLSAASAYFKLLFSEEYARDPVVIFTDIRFNDLEAVLRLIYIGEVKVSEDRLAELLNVLRFLQIGVYCNELASSICEKVKGEDCVQQLADNKHIVQHYLPWERSSQTTVASGYGSDVLSTLPCEVKSDPENCENHFTVRTSESAFGYEFSCLESDIEIKDEEISWNQKIEKDDTATRIEDELKMLEDGNNDNNKEVSPGEDDAKLRRPCLAPAAAEGAGAEAASASRQPPTTTTTTTTTTRGRGRKRAARAAATAELEIEDAVGQCESGEIHGEEPFTRPSCDFRTTQEAGLTEHMRNHILAGPFELSHCNLSGMEPSASNNSEFQNRKGQPFKRPRTTALEEGSASTNYKEKPFKCVHCSFASTRKGSLIPHMRTHSGEKPFQCSQCTYASTQKNDLKIHMCTHSGEKPFQCSQCTYACSYKGNLKIHMRTHSGEKPFQCSQCTYACSYKGNLKIHMRTHSGEKPFQCSQCTYACSYKGNLKIHMRTHSGEKPFQCSQCTYACSYKGNLKIHMRTHSGEKPFQCSQCTYASTQKNDLKIHMRTHSGEKPFQCSQCTYACSYKGNLKIHMRTHSGEKPFQCSQCTYASTQKNDLKIHMRTHSGEKPFQCSQCTYASTRKNNLKIHMRTHSGEKPFQCSQCTYACSHKGYLRIHMRTHSGEKPFQCSQCTFASTWKNNLKIHMRTH